MEELLNKIVYHAMLKKATDIHFYCEKCCTIRLRIHGSLERYETLDKSEGLKLMNYLKYISHINMNYQLLPQTGHFQYLCDHKFVYCRVSYLPTTKYESIVMRLLDDSVTFKIDQLSLQNNILEFYHWLLKQKSGLFLISGPTGSGKSTTLYTLLQELAKDEKKNIITIEDPVEINVKGCIQVETNEKLGLDDHIILNQILRHDPDVVMIGEIRDEKTAQLALTCALTGTYGFGDNSRWKCNNDVKKAIKPSYFFVGCFRCDNRYCVTTVVL